MSRSEFLNEDDFVDEPRRKKKSSAGWVIVLVIACGAGVMIIPCLIALLLPAVQQAREAARRTQVRNHMKMMGLAYHNFHDAHNHFPPLDPTNRADLPSLNHSWMTLLLPYLDQQPLYESVQLPADWLDPANKAAFSTVVPMFLNPSEPGGPMTPEGYALSHFAANSHVLNYDRPIRIRDMTDGTSNTMLIGQVHDGFKPWGDPDNHRDPANGLGGGPNAFGSPHTGGAHFLMADGSVRFVSNDVLPEVLKALGTPAGNESVIP